MLSTVCKNVRFPDGWFETNRLWSVSRRGRDDGVDDGVDDDSERNSVRSTQNIIDARRRGSRRSREYLYCLSDWVAISALALNFCWQFVWKFGRLFFWWQLVGDCFSDCLTFRQPGGSSPKGTFVPTIVSGSGQPQNERRADVSKKFIASCQMTVCLVVSKKPIFMKHNGYR
jgi:hypothetical protein